VERFGVEKQVCFIPAMVYEPYDGYERFTGPKDNPYKLLLDGIHMMKMSRSLPKEWAALGYTKKDVEGWCEDHGFSSKYAKSVLPGVSYRKFAYAWIYRGYDLDKKKEVESPKSPIGSNPADGLQIVCFSSAVYDAIAKEYATRPRTDGQIQQNIFQCPEPAAEDAGCLNYVWNKQTPNPVTGETASTGDGFGYTAYAVPGYYSSPNTPITPPVDLTLPTEFGDWYFNDAWEPWDSLLKGITGTDQVRLIAEFFPELGPVCEQVWDGYDELMKAWEKAPFIRESTNMNEILYRKFRPNNTKDKDGSRRVATRDSDQLDEEDYDNSRSRSRQRQEPSRSSQRSRLDAGLREEPSYEENEDVEDIGNGRRPDDAYTDGPDDGYADAGYADEPDDGYDEPDAGYRDDGYTDDGVSNLGGSDTDSDLDADIDSEFEDDVPVPVQQEQRRQRHATPAVPLPQQRPQRQQQPQQQTRQPASQSTSQPARQPARQRSPLEAVGAVVQRETQRETRTRQPQTSAPAPNRAAATSTGNAPPKRQPPRSPAAPPKSAPSSRAPAPNRRSNAVYDADDVPF
jgi:hypothetical protein